MKLLLFLLLPFAGMSQYLAYEPIIWIEKKPVPPDTVKVDTVYGRIVYANEYRVVLEKGYRVDRTGKESLQVDYRTWMGEAILPKNVIKFIENE